MWVSNMIKALSCDAKNLPIVWQCVNCSFCFQTSSHVMPRHVNMAVLALRIQRVPLVHVQMDTEGHAVREVQLKYRLLTIHDEFYL